MADARFVAVCECVRAQLLGSVLAEDVKCIEPVPPFPASMVDGYAVIASDGPGEVRGTMWVR